VVGNRSIFTNVFEFLRKLIGIFAIVVVCGLALVLALGVPFLTRSTTITPPSVYTAGTIIPTISESNYFGITYVSSANSKVVCQWLIIYGGSVSEHFVTNGTTETSGYFFTQGNYSTGFTTTTNISETAGYVYTDTTDRYPHETCTIIQGWCPSRP